MLFYGMWSATVNGKGRVNIPAEFIEKLKNPIIIFRASNGCIRIYPGTVQDGLTPSMLWLRDLDSLGRVVIPKILGIKSQKMVWYGEGEYLELRQPIMNLRDLHLSNIEIRFD